MLSKLNGQVDSLLSDSCVDTCRMLGMLAVNRISELKNRPRVTEKTDAPMPSLAVVLPCHGSYSFARICERWNSQLNTTYSGPVSFVYVVESLDDPAFMTICRYLSQVHGLEEAGKAALSQDPSYLEKDVMLETSPHRSVRLAVAGVTSRSSQKIHNMLFALRDCTADFVAFLDDDIKVHREHWTALCLPSAPIRTRWFLQDIALRSQ